MGEQSNPKPLCAICMIEVDGNTVNLERLMSFHGSIQDRAWDGKWQRELDNRYNWNMNW